MGDDRLRLLCNGLQQKKEDGAADRRNQREEQLALSQIFGPGTYAGGKLAATIAVILSASATIQHQRRERCKEGSNQH